MKEKSRYSIPLAYKNQVKSLCWVNDYLVDFVGGLVTFHLNGEIGVMKVNYTYRFDNAITTFDGEYSIIYENFGTKGLILKQGKYVREINRSYYCAEHYEYPVTIFSHDGKVYIAHCPDEYNLIEIEEIETGKRITQKDRPSHDFFQSRLQVSPDKKWLLSAGWIWHPIDAIEIYDLTVDLSNPRVLSPFGENSLGDIGLWEVYNAVFMNDSKLLMSGTGDLEQEDTNQEKAIVIYDLTEKKVFSRKVIKELTGKLMPINNDFAVGFYENPKIINLQTGKIVHRWIDIKTDKRNSSIINLNESDKFSHIAIDQINKRFAVAMEENIEVVVF